MPPLPWTTHSDVDPAAEVTVMASRLPLRSFRHVPAFLLWTLRIRRQLAGTPGLVGYGLDAQLLRKTFWTVSAWESPRDLGRFHRASPHHDAVQRIRPHMGAPTFVTWTGQAADLPVRWDEVRRRVARHPASA